MADGWGCGDCDYHREPRVGWNDLEIVAEAYRLFGDAAKSHRWRHWQYRRVFPFFDHDVRETPHCALERGQGQEQVSHDHKVLVWEDDCFLNHAEVADEDGGHWVSGPGGLRTWV